MNRKKLFLIASPLIVVFLFYVFISDGSESSSSVTTTVKKGVFLDEVIISGEAQSTSLKKINGPTDISKYPLNNVKIQDLIPEGTIIKKGDYVGRLDPSELNGQIINAQLNLENAQSKFTQEQLDTTLTLKQERTAIKDLEFTLAEDRLELERSIYEPPSTIKQLEIKIERTERDLKEKKGGLPDQETQGHCQNGRGWNRGIQNPKTVGRPYHTATIVYHTLRCKRDGNLCQKLGWFQKKSRFQHKSLGPDNCHFTRPYQNGIQDLCQ